jgi:GNAT superfamily N-acetyltransferase
MPKKEPPTLIPLVGKFSYTVALTPGNELDVWLYEGKTKVGRITMAPMQRVRGFCSDLLRQLGAPIEAVRGPYVRIPARVWCAVDTMVSPAKRGKGYGRFLYEVGMRVAYHAPMYDYVEERELPPGPFYFLPDECGLSAQTSSEARRVWTSLRREWPAAYGVVMNTLMFREVEVTVIGVDREPVLHPPTRKV